MSRIPRSQTKEKYNTESQKSNLSAHSSSNGQLEIEIIMICRTDDKKRESETEIGGKENEIIERKI